jgi:hypothetical protein
MAELINANPQTPEMSRHVVFKNKLPGFEKQGSGA